MSAPKEQVVAAFDVPWGYTPFVRRKQNPAPGEWAWELVIAAPVTGKIVLVNGPKKRRSKKKR